MKRIILLVRVSTRYQSYDAQKQELVEYAQGHGYTVKDMEIIEDKESATKLSDEERQGLNKMYAAMNNPNNPIEAVYCWELSRLSRKPESLYKVRNELLNRKIDLRTKHENFKLLNEKKELDPNSNVMLGFYISMCENEIHRKVERTKRIKTQKALEGKYTGGKIKYGYLYDGKTKEYKVDEDEAPTIRAVFNLYETGKYGVYTLYKEMIKRGYKINIHQINRILTSPEYIGGIRKEYTEIQKRRTQKADRIIHRYSRYYPSIINKTIYDKCREIAKQNNNNIDKSKNIYYAHKLIKCSSCGAYLVASKHTIQYQCPKKYSPLTKTECSATDRININIIDSLLWFLSKKKEALFIVNQSEKQIEEYQSKINELRLKVKTSDTAYETIRDEKRKQLKKIFAYKNEKEIDNLITDATINDKREIEENKVSWKNEIERLEKLIDEIYNTLHTEGLSEHWRNFEKKYQSNWIEENYLDKIKDDNQIYDLTHKHIREVNLKKVEDIFKPGKYTKEITIKYYEGDNDIYYYDGQTRLTFKNIYQITTPHQLMESKGIKLTENDSEYQDNTTTKIQRFFELKNRFKRQVKE